MPANNRVAIEIYVDDQGSVHVREFAANTNQALDQVEKKSQTVTQRIQAGWGSVKAAWVEITAGVMAMREAWDTANLAAKARQEKIAFESLAQSYGTNSKTIIAALKEASGETIATMDLIRDSGTAMMMGIDPDTVVELMKIARATAKMTGQEVSKAFGDISLAVGRQSRMILDNLGIIVDVGKANEVYAAKLKITVSQLTDADKKQAFLNATLAGGTELMEKLGNQTDTMADRMQRFTAKAADAKVMVGEVLLRAFNFLDGTFTSVAAAALAVSGGIFKIIESAASLTDRLHITSNAAQEWKINSQAAFGAANELAVKADQAFKDMKAGAEKATASQAKLRAKIDQAREAVQQQAEAEKKLDDQRKGIISAAKKQAKEQASITAEMYKATGQGADKYFADEASRLVEKAAQWEKAGGDQLAIEEWLYDEVGRLSQEAWDKGEAAAGQYLDSVQTQSRTLVEEFNALQQTAQEQLDAIAGQALALDGTDIGLTVSFDGSAAMQGLDQLIERLRAMQQVAATAGKGQSSNTTQQSSTQSSAQQKSTTTTNNSSSTTINFNQKLSRGDVNNILNEQKRQENRT